MRSNGILWGAGGGDRPSEKFRLVEKLDICVAADCDSKKQETKGIMISLWSC